MHSLPVLGLGIAVALMGLGLFAITLRKAEAAKPATAPVKKSEQRAIEVQRTESTKLRIAAAVMVLIGAVVMILS